MNIAVFASHGGSDLQAIIDGCKNKKINGHVCAVISNNSDAYALQRARNEEIDCYCINATKHPNCSDLDMQLLDILVLHNTDMIFLAGYLKKIGIPILQKYDNRIFNIHPALLPKYGGKGMYGMNVHRAVVEAGEKVSGVTVHRVNEEYDSGDIVSQTRVDVLPNDTPESLAARILEREHSFLVEVVNNIISGKIKLGR
ncbi:Phosphoribosylglycinamide formyltransferase [bioreactor metagenome]|uniref:phosphoribosylglycinamide formyltransferase 1 n=1 Tax=bioreactor metagenome TaxID=1076179 RepID=A0A644ZTM6_9ZZZZ|nr:phosphoribosylglycinamide formyltransferase [Oscillospiraceae bacterium]